MAGAGGGWSFETNKASGGVLMLPFPAKARLVHECLTFIDYVRKHHSTWYHFAKSIGFDCKPEDVIISRGYVKTPRWTVAALQHESHSHKVFLQGQFAAVATAGIHFSLARDQAMCIPIVCLSGSPGPPSNKVILRPRRAGFPFATSSSR